MIPALASQRVVDRVTQRAVAVVATTAVAEAEHLPTAVVVTAITAVKAAAISAVAHVPPTLVSQDKTQVTAAEMVKEMGKVMAKAMVPRHAVSAARMRRARRATISMKANRAFRAMKCSAKTHAARAWTWVSSPTILTNANPPAMCLQAFHHQACPHGAQVVVVEVATVVAVVVVVIAAVQAAETGAAVVLAQVVAEAEAEVAVTPVAGFSASWVIGLLDYCVNSRKKSSLELLFLRF